VARPENSLEYTSTGEVYRGSRIRERRRAKGLSRERMAKLVGCHPDSLSNVETNEVNPSEQLLSKIAEVLGDPVEHFTQAPVHPRILSKKAAQAIAQPQVVSPLASRPLTTPQSSREAVLKLLEEAGVVSDEDLKGFALVKIKEDEAEKKGDRTSDTSIPSIAHPVIDTQNVLLGSTGKEIERLLGSARLPEDEEKQIAVEVIEFTKRLLALNEALRALRKSEESRQ
jgi:transcriptional regulator with XRE-family HTH domain